MSKTTSTAAATLYLAALTFCFPARSRAQSVARPLPPAAVGAGAIPAESSPFDFNAASAVSSANLAGFGTGDRPRRAYAPAKIQRGASLLSSPAASDPGFFDGSLSRKTLGESAPAVDASASAAPRPTELRTPATARPAASVPAPQSPSPEPGVSYHKAKNPKTGPVGAKRLDPIWWLKNDDDNPPPADYEPNMKPEWRREVMWWFRNPFANFCSYVVGVEDKDFTITGRYPGNVGNPNNGWNWTVIHYEWLDLPFISYTHKFTKKEFNFYLGWRPAGCIGAKLAIQPIQAQKKPKPTPAS